MDNRDFEYFFKVIGNAVLFLLSAIVLAFLILGPDVAQAQKKDEPVRTYQVDKYGAKEYSKGHLETNPKTGVTVQVDKHGQKEWSKGSWITETPKNGSKAKSK